MYDVLCTHTYTRWTVLCVKGYGEKLQASVDMFIVLIVAGMAAMQTRIFGYESVDLKFYRFYDHLDT